MIMMMGLLMNLFKKYINILSDNIININES